jgi:hypothetical protein
VGAYELVRRLRVLGWLVFAALPVAITPWLIQTGAMDRYGWFGWAKLYSICAFAIFFLLIRSERFASWSTGKWAHWVAWTLLVLNILEAVGKDLNSGHIFNAIAGIVLIVTLPTTAAFKVGPPPIRDYRVGIPVTWVLLYTFWNYVFVLDNYPFMAYRQLAILAAPLLIGFWSVAGSSTRPPYDTGCWLQARVFTLAMHLVAFMVLFDVYEAVGLEKELDHSLEWLGIVSAVLAAGVLIRVIVARRSKRESNYALSLTAKLF